MAHRRGNPNWGSGRRSLMSPVLPTSFDEEIKKLGLNDQTCRTSKELERWCERNKNHCYIPEWLLTLWGMSVDS
jgi:hypothetical protein